MNRQSILSTLKGHQAELRRHGVLHAALFGSMARETAGPGSDIDIMLDLDPRAVLSIYDYMDLKAYIGSLFDQPVDVINREGLKPYLRQSAISDAIYAF